MLDMVFCIETAERSAGDFMEKTNARDLMKLPETIDLVTIDASFISLKIILPVVKNWLKGSESQVIGLIKPQFEAGKAEAAKGRGVIRDRAVHRQVLEEILRFAEQLGFEVRGLIRSPLTGPKGNIEYLVWLKNQPGNGDDLMKLLAAAV